MAKRPLSLSTDDLNGWLSFVDDTVRWVQRGTDRLLGYNVRETITALAAERDQLQGEVNPLLHFASLVRDARDMDDVAVALEVLDEARAAVAAVAAVEAEVRVLRAAAEVVNADA